MIDYQYSELFLQSSVQKDFIITDGVVSVAGGSFVYNDYTYLLTNDNLKSVPKIYETLCDDENLDFGSCRSNYIEFSIAADIIPLIGKNCRVYIWMNNDVRTLFRIGKYKIKSDKATADRNYRNVVAYDKMDEMLNADVTDWYESLFPSDASIISVRAMRQSFCQHFGIDDETDTSDMVNDLVTCGKTIHPSSGSYISGETILRAICSANGGFGNIDRDGDFRCIVLPIGIVGLYPRVDLYPSDDLYPREDISSLISQGAYIPPLPYEDYYTSEITRIQIREDDEDQGVMVGEEGNDYILEGNFIFFGKDASELEAIATRLLGRIGNTSYMPFGPVHAFGNPTYEVGDPVRFRTGDTKIHSYILKRTITGTIALDDEYEAVGNQFRDDKSSNLSSSVDKLKSKTAKIEVNVDNLTSELSDLDTRESSHFTQTSGAITAEITRATEAEGTLSTSISTTASGLTAEITRATEAEGTLSSRITANAGQIALKVTKSQLVDDLDDEIGSSIEITENKIEFKSSGTLIVNTTNFKLDARGNSEFSGTVKGATIEGGTLTIGDTVGSYGKIQIYNDGQLTASPNASSGSYLRIATVAHGTGGGGITGYSSALQIYDDVDNVGISVGQEGIFVRSGTPIHGIGDVEITPSGIEINNNSVLTTGSSIPASNLTGSISTSLLSGYISASMISGGTLSSSVLPNYISLDTLTYDNDIILIRGKSFAKIQFYSEYSRETVTLNQILNACNLP